MKKPCYETVVRRIKICLGKHLKCRAHPMYGNSELSMMGSGQKPSRTKPQPDINLPDINPTPNSATPDKNPPLYMYIKAY